MRRLAPWILLAAGLAGGVALQSQLYTAQERVVGTVFMFIALATAWNLIGGFTGYPWFGQVGFFGLGAYATALFMYHLHLSFWLSLALVCAWSFYFAREWPIVPILLLAVLGYETWACVRLVFFRPRHLMYLQRIRHAPLLLLKVPADLRLGLCGFLLYKHLFG